MDPSNLEILMHLNSNITTKSVLEISPFSLVFTFFIL